MGLLRTGVAIESELLQRFDDYIENEGFANRSEAVRDLIRDRLNEAGLKSGNAFVVGTVTLIYDHHSRLLPGKLTELQHKYHELIISTVHAHLDHDLCLETVVVKGMLRRVKELADQLIGIKGVQHGKLVASSPGAYVTKRARAGSGNSHGHNHEHHGRATSGKHS